MFENIQGHVQVQNGAQRFATVS